jgi:hypothetical protein
MSVTVCPISWRSSNCADPRGKLLAAVRVPQIERVGRGSWPLTGPPVSAEQIGKGADQSGSLFRVTPNGLQGALADSKPPPLARWPIPSLAPPCFKTGRGMG